MAPRTRAAASKSTPTSSPEPEPARSPSPSKLKPKQAPKDQAGIPGDIIVASLMVIVGIVIIYFAIAHHIQNNMEA